MIKKIQLPEDVLRVLQKLKKAGFLAFLVGGCVRDLLRKKNPQDWDVATDAKPKEIQKIFPKSFLDNKFGTVTVLTPNLKQIQVTPFRIESKYTDKRHPDKVFWAKTIEEDLARRDFTINAIALEIEFSKFKSKEVLIKRIIDPFDGQKDLKAKIVRAVGNPQERFEEDALRLMRAVRFVVTLGENWQLEEKTKKAIQEKAGLLRFISKERIRDEFLKIIMSERAAQGIELLRQLNLLKEILPELEEGYKVSQNKHHIYDVYEHSLRSLDYAAKKGFSKEVRIASLLHDIAKPRTKKGEGPNATFYGHEVLGAKMTAQILQRLRFPKKEIEKIVKLVRYHLFYYNVGKVKESSVRRLIRKVGIENMPQLLELRQADRIGSGCPKAEPYRLRHLKYMIEKVSKDPISVKMLKVSGHDVMRILKIEPSPKIGQILDILLGEVLEDPQKNQKEFLEKEIEKLGKLPAEELKNLAQKARAQRDEIEMKRDEMTKKKYWLI